ncbi:MAG TPA: anthranilate synthase component I family protein [Candidatus Fraserbacteria bacterium]|nr:anthranilate synthase component I family protein [Candidatus Fraserbacteria bacterium]
MKSSRVIGFGPALLPPDLTTPPDLSSSSISQFKHRQKRHSHLRICQLPEHDPFKLYAALRRRYRTSFILESAPGPRRLAEYTFIGFAPHRRLALRQGRLSIDESDQGPLDDPLGALRDTLAGYRMAQLGAPFGKYFGGLVGYLGYDFVRRLEALPERPGPTVEEPGFPDFELGLYLDGVIYDHARRAVYYFTHDQDRSQAVREALADQAGATQQQPLICSPFQSDISRQEFIAGVQQAQEAIRAGEVYQVVLSKRLRANYHGDLLAGYGALRQVNPSPYMYFVQFEGRTIAGSSPEMLVALRGRQVITYPIAGTRPLGRSEAERARLAGELLADRKERAEHVMLVDLARNDIGRIAEFGSVKLPEYMRVERFSHVQHLVSRVEGRLRPELDAFDALAALFPAGTVSGAPKLRAMELIARLEKSPRGPYAGVVGYFSLNGTLDTAIAIRTLFAQGESLYLRAGAGIVADSQPEREWQECDGKLAALLSVLQGGLPCGC